jgi:hypothetical protein
LIKGTSRGTGRLGLLASTIGTFALLAPAVAAADVGPVKGLPAPAPTAVTPVLPTAKVPPATDAVANAAATAANAASAAATPTTRGVGVTAAKATPLAPHVSVKVQKLPASFSATAAAKQSSRVFLVLRKHGKLTVTFTFKKGVRGLAGNQPQCSAQPDGSTNCIVMLMGNYPNTCADDLVTVLPDSWFHEKSSMTVGVGSVTMTDFVNWQNVKGVSEDGTPYSMMDITRSSSTTYALPAPGSRTTVVRDETQQLLSHGPKPNQQLRVTTSVSFGVDANGMPFFEMPTVSGPGMKCTG